MAFTYDPATDAGKVRLIIKDTDTADTAKQIFQDAEIDAFLELQDGDVKLAAAEALDTIASSQTLTLKKLKLGDIGTDGPAVAASLRNHAASLRAQVADSGDAFAIVDLGGC
jgi:hypothetical protein